MNKICFLFLILLFSLHGKAQTTEKVQLVQAGALEGGIVDGEELRKLIGNVIFKHNGAFLYCDSAYQYEKKNEIICFGNVRMNQGDTIILTGKKMRYNGNTKKAIVTESVILKDRKMTLSTDYLDYDTKNKLATYQGGGKIIDDANVLTSKIGYYNTASKIFWFKRDVKIVNEKEKYTLTSDTLQYHSITKVATFRGPSKVTKENDILYADHGEYDTAKGRSIFTGRAKVESGKYVLDGDRLRYDEVGKYGIGEGNVVVTSLENNIVVYGDLAHYWGKEGIVKITGNPLVKNKMEKDTLYLVADTLISVDRKNPKDTSLKEKYLQAFHHVKLYKKDLQVICDSLIYNFVDSVIYLYTDPVMWSGVNQIEADSINIEMKNNKIYRLNTHVNSLIISQDTIKHFNQVKGKKMVAYFKDDKISRVVVSGNGQSIYYAMEDKSTKLLGMNKADCSNIVIKFEEGNVRTISFITKPDAKFIPPHEIVDGETRLKGFKWRLNEKPTKKEVVEVRSMKEEDSVKIPYNPNYKPQKDSIGKKAEPTMKVLE
ncbi:MAG TPA: OstA-like protein [Cytophagaceae bacterium]|jgi:lipopolysaccharide export system protein LptA|nr:OstA-like protein [Cytophagaceae bacterium]